MPTYVYRRPDGTTFEVFQKISDPSLTEDPGTGVPVQRVISGGAGLQFKGDGFYLTDYVRKGKDGSSESKGESSGDGDSKKAEPKQKESKPATKAASSDD